MIKVNEYKCPNASKKYMYDKYRRLVEFYKEKYSEESLIVYVILLQFLTVVNNFDNSNYDIFCNLLSSVKRMAKHLKMPNNAWEPMSVNERNQIHFNNKYYHDHYEEEFEKYCCNFIKVTRNSIGDYAIGKWYLYIIDECHNLVIYDKPFLPIDILSDRSGFPKHAVLAYRSNLNVYCAGEILLSRNDNGNVRAILNNKSGHFKPDSGHLKIAVNSLEKLGCETFYIDYSK